ncbi:GYDIA family GHMP kinase [Maribacter hydrothermalis]|uniref:GHMP kinase n=1 Tax=Maribacter hydrothermalis TaxID=1836467 RepID=A0A1B7YXX0_9FLAO|nr:GYDIA family GHMP kinase [Maribacter hydrothermalis]APQ16890.1 GHMP kinase [Maribacter hydrothermalis]OBR35319.1 GHMP kinase [Maribacter hydrothermalis]
MTNKFYSNGKLLLTGEYAILDGAMGLALPTKFGQTLQLRNKSTETIHWYGVDENNDTWFYAEFSKVDFKTVTTTDEATSDRLKQIFIETKRLNPDFLSKISENSIIETKFSFPMDWGLGTSSTLIANMATWADINPYQLLESTFGGSGYDIACATHNTAITYQRNGIEPRVNEVNFNPDFKDELFFVYLNQKKNSRDAISTYRNLDFNKVAFISKIDTITENILECSTLTEFENLLNEHEAILSETLQIPTIKDTLFSNYPRTIKSLGAWGGDFVLATGTEEDMLYFKNQGYKTVLPYSKMIL